MALNGKRTVPRSTARKKVYNTSFPGFLGRDFENVILESINVAKNNKKFNDAIPDGLVPVLVFGTPTFCSSYEEDGVFIDVKQTRHNYIKYKLKKPHQIENYISHLTNSKHALDGGVPGILFITPAGTRLAPKIISEGSNAKIAIFQAFVYSNASNPLQLKVGNPCMLNGPIYTDYYPLPFPVGLGVPWRNGFNGYHFDYLMKRRTAILQFNPPTP